MLLLSYFVTVWWCVTSLVDAGIKVGKKGSVLLREILFLLSIPLPSPLIPLHPPLHLLFYPLLLSSPLLLFSSILFSSSSLPLFSSPLLFILILLLLFSSSVSQGAEAASAIQRLNNLDLKGRCIWVREDIKVCW